MSTVLHTESSAGLGGQEIRTLGEARWTREEGWGVLVACQPGSGLMERARAEGLEVEPLSMRGAWDLGALLQLVRLIRARGVSLVHTHSSVDAWLGGMAARLTGVPVVRTRHVSIPIRRGLNPVYRWLADRVVTSGAAIREVVVAAGVPPERVVAIPAGVRLEDFPFRQRREGVARDLGLSPPVIGCVAMFRGSKGHADLLEAFRLVHGQRPTATLLLVGEGIRRTWAEGLAREAGLHERVVFTGFRFDVPALMSVMDCLVLASTRTEGVPQSLLQAFAAGVPVVGTAIGGIPEVLEDGVTGLLVEPGAPAALARAITRVLDEPAEALERARAARALVEARFSHRASIARLLALYQEVLVSRGRRVA